MKKKILSIVAFAFAAIFMLSACTGGDPELTTPDVTTPGATTPDVTTPAATTPTATDETTAAPAEKEKLKVMCFNVNCGISGTRDVEVMNYLANSGADSIGTQEVADTWISRFKNKQFKDADGVLFRDKYAWVGTGRDSDGRGERCTILYLKEKFELLDSGTKWLTPTPDTFSKISGSEYVRIATYAILKNKETGFTYVHINTHLDTKSGAVKSEQLKHLFNAMPDFGDLPIILTGDFNGAIGSDPYQTVTGTYKFHNAAQKAAKGDDYTSNTSEHGTIDFIFIKNYKFKVDEYHVYTEKKISDHYPIYINIALP